MSPMTEFGSYSAIEACGWINSPQVCIVSFVVLNSLGGEEKHNGALQLRSGVTWGLLH